MNQYTRDELLAICEASFVPQQHWSNRDSASAQRQLGEAYALLKAGCEFWVGRDTDSRTIWLTIEFEGFAHKDYDGGLDTEHFYLPTRERLAGAQGTDWY
ncbi:hypothetical protein [Arthrobacter sp. EpRS71]|uniref:hypothetical protein n=1 Tax=Arthrobacter sp. EpRS71 TaxID=1743141 RepID=UPI00074A873B|nr:hypothetical protein [Arthrobacter sp. EpRS71]KUM34554.1 hypothetical protein AR689_10450 [Arthrobacter sp. EpRS71]